MGALAGQRVPVGWLCCLLFGLGGCDRSEEAKPAAPKPSASAPKPREPSLSCKAPHPGAHYTLGTASRSKQTLADAGSDDVELPFAVELGSATPYGKGYAVAALSNLSDATTANVAIVSQDTREGRLLDLGPVHGDVVPPRVAVQGDQLFAAVVNNDAGSQTLSVLRLEPSAPDPVVARGPAFDQGRDDSSAFDLSFSTKRGLVVWDRYDKSRGHVVLEASSFDASDVTKASEARVVSGDGDDAEMPRIVPRPGGFWLTYVAHGPLEPRDADEDEDAGLDSVVDLTPRRLTILPLDDAGAPTGKPQRLTGERSHVLAYDVARHAGGALVAWRDDPTTLGVEAPVVHLALVKADGSFRTERLEDAEFGAGAPALLPDPSKKASEPWLGVMGSDQLLRLSLVVDAPKLGKPSQLAAPLGLGEPMARVGSDLLLARPRGRVVDLSLASCQAR